MCTSLFKHIPKTKNKTKKVMARKSNKTVYETVSRNIQKITTPTGNISYRVRVGFEGETLSEYASSLKAAKAVRNQLMA
jgi:hypothetical protein